MSIQISQELASLWAQQICEYHEIKDLEAQLAKTRERHQQLCDQISTRLEAERATECSICRRHHGLEVIHACE